MQIWIYSIASVAVVSLVSFVGVISLSLNTQKLRQIILYLVSLSAGALIGDVFIHLLPEAVEGNGFTNAISLYVITGILVSFVIEKIIHWHHCHIHEGENHPHPFAYMNLIGDCVHNVIDGLIIGASYFVSIPVGIATTLAVILHEIPQEIGDFGVLIHGGFDKKRAIWLNFLTALTSVIGVLIVLVIGSGAEGLTNFLIPFAAGNFIYIASTDLIPELHKETATQKSLLQLLVLVVGIAAMYALIYLE